MGSEILLYGYGMICLSMILFNIVYGLIMRGKEARLTGHSRKFEEELDRQLQLIADHQPIDSMHTKHMMKKLSYVNNLRAFDQTLEQYLSKGRDDIIHTYLSQVQYIFLHLANVYGKRDNLQAAYFAYFLCQHKLGSHMRMNGIQDILVDYIKKDSLYCRINAMKALCIIGSPDCILRAMTIQDQSDSFLHGKIITECLLTYAGDSDQLIRMFWEHMDDFSIPTRRAILDYIRFKSGDYCEEIFQILTDPKQNRELRFSAIRYFSRYAWPPAREYLLAFLKNTLPEDWEYAAISATALAAYPGKDVVEALTAAMHSYNWYIRYNAASSLESLGLGYSDLMDLVGGRDRYAREMIMYRLESRRLMTEQQEMKEEQDMK